MRRIVLALAVSAIATPSIFAAGAAASGPAAPGKETVEVECAGLGTITISVPRPEQSRGAGQIVGQKGHGIPVTVSFTLTDVTTSKVLFSESRAVGGGHAHPNQPTTQCKATGFEGPASVFFEGHELPPGVGPNDTIRASTEVQVIVKN
jgi:hypothetical protein